MTRCRQNQSDGLFSKDSYFVKKIPEGIPYDAVGMTDEDVLKTLKEDPEQGRRLLVIRCLGLSAFLVRKAVAKYGVSEAVTEDLCAEGMVGLVQAAQAYDPSRKVKFTTFAFYYVQSAVYKALGHYPSFAKPVETAMESGDEGWDDPRRLARSGWLSDGGDPVRQRALEQQARAREREREGRLTVEVARLPLLEKEAVIAFFGLFGHPKETAKALSFRLGLSVPTIFRLKRKALARLKAALTTPEERKELGNALTCRSR